MKLAKSLDRLGTETAFSVLAEAKKLEAQGKPMIHLGLGQPDFKTPKHIVEAAASTICFGVLKSGCPNPRWIIGFPCASNFFASANTLKAVSVPNLSKLFANFIKFFYFLKIILFLSISDRFLQPINIMLRSISSCIF